MTRIRHSRWWPALATTLVFMCASPGPAAGAAPGLDPGRDDIRRFIDELVKDEGFEPGYVSGVFAGVERKQSVLDAISRPAERVKPWYEYREIFVTPARIRAGVEFHGRHAARLRQVSEATGVPTEILTAILGVETFYGTRTGGFRVVDSLATLAFDYPPRADFFRRELRQLFLLARDERLDIGSLTGSYAGAMGPPQFIPSSYRAYAVDGSGDGRRDLIADWDDIVASIANYFVQHDWQPGQPVAVRAELRDGASAPADSNELGLRHTVASLAAEGLDFASPVADESPALPVRLEGREGTEHWVGFRNFYAITRYNRSVMYALAVHQLAEAIAAELPAADRALADAD